MDFVEMMALLDEMRETVSEEKIRQRVLVKAANTLLKNTHGTEIVVTHYLGGKPCMVKLTAERISS